MTLNEELLLYAENYGWDELIKNKILPDEFIRLYKSKLNMRNLIRFQTLTENYIRNFKNELDWVYISLYQQLRESFIEEFKFWVNWEIISYSQRLSESFMHKYLTDCYPDYPEHIPHPSENESRHPDHPDHLKNCRPYDSYWYNYEYDEIEEEWIERFHYAHEDHISITHPDNPKNKDYKCKLNMKVLAKYQYLSEGFLRYFIKLPGSQYNHFDWAVKLWRDNNIFKYQTVSSSFLDNILSYDSNNSQYVDWYSIVRFQVLTEDFIKKYGLVRYPELTRYQKVSNEFLLLNGLTVDPDNWLYKSEGFKKSKIIETKDYECFSNYFIAYKAVRGDRSSLYNFRHQYTRSSVQNSSADYSREENSFGLSVWTKKNATLYGEKNGKQFIIIRCKVFYKDVARIVQNGNKVRCCSLQVLD